MKSQEKEKSLIYSVRSGHEEKDNFDEIFSKYVTLSLIFYVILDTITTLFGIEIFGLTEYNPFMSWVINTFDVWIVFALLIKLAIHFICVSIARHNESLVLLKLLLVLGIYVTIGNTLGILDSIGVF